MYFDDAALNWDTDSRIKRAKFLSLKVSEELYNTSDLSALDFGCGTGLLSFYLSDTFKEITCSDLSDKMLQVLNEKILLSKADNINTVNVNDLYDSRYENKFDVIFSSMVFHHIIDIKLEISRLCKLLKENGSLIMIDLDSVDKQFHSDCPDFDGHNGFNRREIDNVFESCGLKDISIKTVYSGQKIIGNYYIDYSLFLAKGTK